MKNFIALFLARLGLAAALLLGGSSLLIASEDHVITVNDSDGDRIVDTVDVDDDNDGIPDVLEIAPNGVDIDSDRDGMPDRLDLDSDNDGILDWQESGVVVSVDFSNMRVVSGRILGPVGLNGLNDALETVVDTAQLRYTLINSDYPEDELPDVLDLDSDNDGLPDLIEAGVSPSLDANNDARIDAGVVGSDGISDRLQSINDKTCCDVNEDGIEDIVPRNSDVSDLPDFQDLDSDNDSVSDIIEAGGNDFDGNGRVDNFFDSPVLDGMDDAILLIPYTWSDNNGNGVEDFIDNFAQAGAGAPQVQPSNVVNTSANTPETFTTETTPAELAVVENVSPAEDGAATEIVDREPVARPGDNIMLANADLPQEDDPSALEITTGLNAAGCSVQSTGTDLLLLLLAVCSIAILGWRYSLRNALFRRRR